MMERFFAVSGSTIMFLGVAAGAFGAHALSSRFAAFPALKASYDTALRYQLIHGLALFAVAWAAVKWPGTLVSAAGYLFLGGIVFFSGSLYVLSLSGVRWLGAITPIGGVLFLAGWMALLLAAWRG